MVNYTTTPSSITDFSKRIFHISITLMLIQNILLLVPLVAVFIFPDIAIIIFYLSVWLDILAITLLIFGVLGIGTNLSPIKAKNVKLIASLLLIWLLLTLFWRVLTATSTGIPILQDKRLYSYLLVIWVIAGFIYSVAIVLFKRFLQEIHFRDYWFVTIYALANVLAMIVIAIGLIFAQPAINQITNLASSNESTNTLLLQLSILSIGVIIKITIIPLLGIAAFYTIRIVSAEILALEDNTEFLNEAKPKTYDFGQAKRKLKSKFKNY